MAIDPRPVTVEQNGVRLEPLTVDHRDGLAAAAADGRLWDLWFTSVPEPDQTSAYIASALAGRRDGHMLPWAVRELTTGAVVGSTRYHDIVSAIDRVEIGYTWYGRRWQRSHVNTACKLMLLEHAFDTVGAKVVGLRTDGVNIASQRAIEALGAKKDGVIRHHQARRDGSARDTVMYSILASEWSDVRRRLEDRLARHAVRIETYLPEHELAVDPSVRGRGIGHRLVDACLAFARDRGVTRIVLLSNSRLMDAIRLYESYGFQHRPVPADALYVSTDVYMELTIAKNASDVCLRNT